MGKPTGAEAGPTNFSLVFNSLLGACVLFFQIGRTLSGVEHAVNQGKKVHIDWTSLEAACENHAPDARSYLDRSVGVA